jgi:hypothetical protein
MAGFVDRDPLAPDAMMALGPGISPERLEKLSKRMQVSRMKMDTHTRRGKP